MLPVPVESVVVNSRFPCADLIEKFVLRFISSLDDISLLLASIDVKVIFLIFWVGPTLLFCCVPIVIEGETWLLVIKMLFI